MASGFLEVQGFTAALLAMNAMCKGADIRLEAVDANNTLDEKSAAVPVVIQVKISGDIGNVRAALEAGEDAACRLIPANCILSHCIPSKTGQLEALLREGKLARGRLKAKRFPALASLDVQCFAHAVQVLDTLLKGTGAQAVDMKKYLGGRMVTLLLGGTVSEMQAAIDLAGRQYGELPALKNAAVILNPHEELYRFIG